VFVYLGALTVYVILPARMEDLFVYQVRVESAKVN
jgi:hypothetical protein